jgi:hypothetical protein
MKIRAMAIGADAMVRADRRRPADRASKGPDLLLNAEDASGMAKCLKPGWKGEEELGGQGGCPVEGQWHGKLKGRQVLRDPGWTCSHAWAPLSISGTENR